VVKLLVPACYAMGNTRVPVLSSVVAVTMTLVLKLVTVHRFGYWGLALGTSIAALLNAGFLLAAVQKILKQAGGRLEMRPLGASLAKNLCVALVMGVVIHFTYRVLNVVLPDLVLAQILGKFGTVLSRVLKLAAAMLEGLILVLLLSKALGMADVAEGVDIFAQHFRR
jgi:putative peptidoglycan lipid II flippase